MNDNEYRCRICKTIWEFIPEDYPDPSYYPTECALCRMPLRQMFKDCYRVGGIPEILRVLIRRYIFRFL